MSASLLQEQIRRRREAQMAFTRAAAYALEVDQEALANALLFGAIGVMHIVQSDPEGKLLRVVVAALEAVRDGKLPAG